MNLFNWHVPGTDGDPKGERIAQLESQLEDAQDRLGVAYLALDRLNEKLGVERAELERVTSLKDILKERVAGHIQRENAQERAIPKARDEIEEGKEETKEHKREPGGRGLSSGI